MQIVSVSQVNNRIAKTLEDDPLLYDLNVKGEISNLNYHYSGHVYFTLKDESSILKCVFFKSYVDKLSFKLEEGMEVICLGNINLYKKGGSYSLNVRSIVEENSKGSLAIKFNELKEKLSKEGLFDESHKKELPFFPKNIGICTSNTGAAIEDIKRIILEKNNYVNLYIFPCKVQGEGASISISNTIDLINKEHKYIDVIIVGRGGGSEEDLWAFNEENVAYAIYNSKIPIVSSVGHEIDISISDFVADKSAPTPTKAAEMVAPNINDIRMLIENFMTNSSNDLKKKLSYSYLKIDNIKQDMTNAIFDRVKDFEHSLSLYKMALTDNNPTNVLNKGYSILRNDNSEVIKSIKDFNENSKYLLTLADGNIEFNPINVKKGK